MFSTLSALVFCIVCSCFLHCLPLFSTLSALVFYIVCPCFLHCLLLFSALSALVFYIVCPCFLHYLPLFSTLSALVFYIVCPCFLHCLLLFLSLFFKTRPTTEPDDNKYLNKPLCDNFDEFQVPHYQFLSRIVLMSHSGSSASEVCKLDLKKQNGVINFCNCIAMELM
jgi:hypothetical protein